jgi:putative SbcD/Mre11-related phosphoesterase
MPAVNLEPVPDMPALVIRGRRKWACIVDLHLGIEASLRASGFNVPTQMPGMLTSMESLASHADRLLILGDVKHRITHASRREDREVGHVMKRLMDLFQAIVITPGNHDGGLRAVVPDGCVIASVQGTVIEQAGVFHGHVWPSQKTMSARKLVMGHVHPSVLLEDSMGGRINEKCWYRAPMLKEKVLERYPSCPEELVVVPAFNPLITGSPVNADGRLLGPVLRNGLVDAATARAYLMDGTNLGTPPKVSRKAVRSG